MSGKIKTKLIFMLFMASMTAIYGQTETDKSKKSDVVIIKMKNGEEFKGEIIKKDENNITIKTVNGELNLIASNVKSVETYDYNGKYRFPNPHDTRYYFGPSAIPIKEEKGYYQNVLVVGNFVNYGVTKNFSLGGGFEFISTVLGSPIWFLTPKAGFQVSKNAYVAGGLLVAGFSSKETLTEIATLGYSVLTIGNSDSNFSVGIGYGLISGELSEYPAIMVGGTHRVSNGIALLAENYYVNNTYFGIHGIRILSQKNAFDIGLIIVPEIASSIPALPFVGYSRSF